MKIRITRIDKTLPLPSYQTKGAVAVDLCARLDTEIPSKTIALIPSNVIIEIPEGYMFAVIPRSGTPRKVGLSIPHGIGVIDQDFNGPDDEILLQVYNFTDQTVTISRGQRICQGIFIKVEKAKWEEVETINKKTRGGFGTTG